MPFDRFTIEQIAGDLLPNSTTEQKVARGFLRNTLTNREAGAKLEQFRYEQIIDRTNTVATVWLGLTVRCAQCQTPTRSRTLAFRLSPVATNSSELSTRH
jgi:Protein of unknown function (DUF1549)